MVFGGRMKQSSIKLNWIKAQKREREFYKKRSQSIPDNYLQLHSNYWKGILSLIPELQISQPDTVLDVGCGPTTILTEVSCEKKIGVDPLIDFYQEKFNLPEEVNYIKGKVENLDKIINEDVNIIFAMNSIDHIEDISMISKIFYKLLTKNGKLVVLLNIARYKLIGKITGIISGYKILDPTHPYHFHSPNAVTKVFDDYFSVLKIIDVTDLRSKQTKIVKKNIVKEKVGFIKRIAFSIHNFMNSQDTYLFVFEKKLKSV